MRNRNQKVTIYFQDSPSLYRSTRREPIQFRQFKYHSIASRSELIFALPYSLELLGNINEVIYHWQTYIFYSRLTFIRVEVIIPKRRGPRTDP